MPQDREGVAEKLGLEASPEKQASGFLSPRDANSVVRKRESPGGDGADSGDLQPAAKKPSRACAGMSGKIGDGQKDVEEFRNYEDSDRHSVVQRHYRMMRQNQTVDYVQRMYKKFCWFEPDGKPIDREPHEMMEIWQAFEALGDYVDSSDPDSEFPNIEHAFQTAEGIRAAGYPEWMQLIGLVHDIGKMMFKYGTPEEGMEGTATGCQWALGGDTWVVGCKLPEGACFPEFNRLNPDMSDPRYNTEMGMYTPGQGMETLMYAFGHDEYAYQVVRHHRDQLVAKGHLKEDLIPDEGLAMLRYHSCYPWHNKGEYDRFMAPGDEKLKEAVLKFNRFDLYTKADRRPDIPALWPYYQKLIDRFLPGKLAW